MSRLTIRLTRTSPTHHRFASTRADGSGEERELETKSCLFHDLLHFALETEVGLRQSFAAHGERLPAWCTAGLVDRVRERMRRLEGQWRGTPFGQTMELRFHAGDGAAPEAAAR